MIEALLYKNKIEWVDLKSNSVSSIVYNFVLNLITTKNSITKLDRLITTGYKAIDYRNKFSVCYKEFKIKLLGNSLCLEILLNQ